jgi:hypothetical protein
MEASIFALEGRNNATIKNKATMTRNMIPRILRAFMFEVF